MQCKRCKRVKQFSDFWYKDRNVCTLCLLRGQVSNANARARGYGKVAELTAFQWLEILKLHDNSCALCGGNCSRFTLEIDHIIPLSKGGTHELPNLRPLCNPCNVSKGNGERFGRKWKPLELFPCTCPRKTEPIEQHYTKCVLRMAVKRREAQKEKEQL